VILCRQIDNCLIHSRLGAISRYRQTGQLGPHLFSIPLLLFARHISDLNSFPCPTLLDPPPLLPPLSRLELFRLLFSAAMSNRWRSLLSFPSFCHTNPICVRLFPHVVLIIYTFSISRLLFSQLSDQTGEAFISPLIHLYARQCNSAFPRTLLIVYPSERDPAKISLSARPARLFLIITSIPQRNAGVHKPSPYLAHHGNNHHRISHQ
jgi:hypothetical protein